MVVGVSLVGRPPENLGMLGRSLEDMRDTVAVLTPVWDAIALTERFKSSKDSISSVLAEERGLMMLGMWNQEGFDAK